MIGRRNVRIVILTRGQPEESRTLTPEVPPLRRRVSKYFPKFIKRGRVFRLAYLFKYCIFLYSFNLPSMAAGAPVPVGSQKANREDFVTW